MGQIVRIVIETEDPYHNDIIMALLAGKNLKFATFEGPLACPQCRHFVYAGKRTIRCPNPKCDNPDPLK